MIAFWYQRSMIICGPLEHLAYLYDGRESVGRIKSSFECHERRSNDCWQEALLFRRWANHASDGAWPLARAFCCGVRDRERTVLVTAVLLVGVVERLQERFLLVSVVLVGLGLRQVMDAVIRHIRKPVITGARGGRADSRRQARRRPRRSDERVSSRMRLR